MKNDFNSLNQTIANSHAVIVEIPKGYGEEFVIEKIKLAKPSLIIQLSPRIHDNQKTETINAEDIAEIQAKVRMSSQESQFYFIHSAEKMNESAQNKFLKLFEEPRKNLHFVLFTHDISRLLLTVKSRAQTIRLNPISDFETIKLLKKFKVDEIKSAQILFLANGLPGEIQRLAMNKKYFNENVKIMKQAKIWAAGNSFEKISEINSLKSDKTLTLEILAKSLNIIEKSAQNNFADSTLENIRKTIKAHKKISANANIRLSLLELAL